MITLKDKFSYHRAKADLNRNEPLPVFERARRTRHCSICEHKIYPKELHLAYHLPIHLKIRLKNGSGSYSTIKILRKNICQLCGDELSTDLLDKESLLVKRLKQMKRFNKKILEKSDLYTIRVLEDKL